MDDPQWAFEHVDEFPNDHASHSDELRQAGKGLIRVDGERPQRVYMVPINSRPFFPAQVMPVVLDFNLWGETLKRVMKT
ncbi:MAG: hypothetical protein WED11_00720, partial [Natronospirillum sp.]